MTDHEQVFGVAPDGAWSAPGRVNLIGEHTDYNEGFVLPLALPHSAVATATRRADRTLRLRSRDVGGTVVELSLDALVPREVEGWAAYPAGVAWALERAGHRLTGADIRFASDVPTGAGLSSSAALEVVTALALSDLNELGLTAPELARIGQIAENDFVGMPCGILDQMASASCVEGHVLHLDTRDLSGRQVPFDMAAEGLRLLVVDTQVKHAHADGAYARRRAECEAGAAALGVPFLRDVPFAELDAALARIEDEAVRRRVRHVVTEDRRVARVVELLDAGRAREIGPLLTEGHASLRDDFEVSCPELDLAVDTANAAGALGSRMTGGGFGGSAIALVPEESVASVGKAVGEAFAGAGLVAPRIFEAIPSAGARRLPA
ncbi:galactokinase [Streptomyces sp. 3MP-14]|uniref:Galactokinase n=1 Tax=Streptomyces mimosae TaxID=2586635 RepID=A0A5N6A8J4_9ACTN|nr:MULTISPECIES: galactokinase [Streptomyces]KAB8164333.1 galactokinase [Streptomyces mimosae]KAB8176610.1 galactokinase [Streptomyces sp. 3MP-14]